MIGRGTQVLRALIVAAFSVFVAAAAHVFAGGSMPSWVALVLALTFAALISIPLIGKRMSLPRVAVAVTIAQTLFHTVFAVIGNPGNVVAQSSGHHDLAFTVLAGSINHGSHGAGAMTAGHIVAGIITIVALRQGVTALSSIAASAGRHLRHLFSTQVVPVVIRRTVVANAVCRDEFVATLQLLRSVVSRRGPPTVSAVFS
ncbi:hypothetical protein I6E68_04345 [Salinibacterium sp. NSLL150]|uniref:hypothetical protein n=1 Tax=unclassified Salinibacterium TaxID=2632331 RepID=UPI0018CF1C6C|nr:MULTISPECIES: hypothetical protein [unclassified Salinibacterium]MBH0098370.1 hypothetical protein [Salinibacterium sp. NSLL35]MBH0101125.1 hypothetical protein [Salinibacterium sp. NSLL150]MBH0103884.1 hypothetical protein [Salinibacterium sp. NSLL16]MBH0106645.1 hypothetical protein [Salinibacterium sp. NSLL17]